MNCHPMTRAIAPRATHGETLLGSMLWILRSRLGSRFLPPEDEREDNDDAENPEAQHGYFLRRSDRDSSRRSVWAARRSAPSAVQRWLQTGHHISSRVGVLFSITPVGWWQDGH